MKADGRSFVPDSAIKAEKVVLPGEFCFSVVGLVHGHVFGMIKGLLEAGATLKSFFEDDDVLANGFLSRFPGAERASSIMDVLSDKSIRLVVNCVLPDVRADLSIAALRSGKDVFSDKPGFLDLEQCAGLEAAVEETRSHYCIYFSERFHAEGPMLAQSLIDQGRIGIVNHYIGTGPHRLNPSSRPYWFFDSHINGSILIDLGCHLVEQFLSNTGNVSAKVEYAFMDNRSHKEHKGFYDTGDIVLRGDNGAEGLIHVDWFTPDGLSTWGDGRTVITGDKGYIEVRKYLDLARSSQPNHVYLADGSGEEHFEATNTLGFPFFGKFIKDCINGTFDSIDPMHCIRAMRIAVEADLFARNIQY